MRIKVGLVLGLLLALAVAGCGGDDGQEGVASAGGPGSQASSDPGTGGLNEQEQALKFGQCMRDNGVPGFADPKFNESGGMSIEVPEGSDPQRVDAAMEACKQYTPNGGEPQKLDSQRLEQLRKLAQCMRENGVTDFPDPTDQGLQLDGNNPGLAPDNPTFKAAEKACAKYQPAAPSGEGPGLGLDRQLAALGTNLLTVAPGESLLGDGAKLPTESVSMISRIGPVTQVAATGRVPETFVYRTDRIPAAQTGAITVRAAHLDLPQTVGADLADGTWLNAATARYPAVVLGSATARRLGVFAAGDGVQIYLGQMWFTVVGILAPVPLAPELDSSALIGWTAAQTYLGFDGHPTTVYTRAADSAVEAVWSVLAATANPQAPNEVKVSRPSDALAARQATDRAFTGLLLGLGAVALLVGGVGVANTMVISVLERRAEIGLRRSLGATRWHIRLQFLAESLLLSALGGVGGMLLGIIVTTGYASTQSWPTVIPVWATLGGVAATLLIGAIAGLYPAIRAARLAPTEALAAP